MVVSSSFAGVSLESLIRRDGTAHCQPTPLVNKTITVASSIDLGDQSLWTNIQFCVPHRACF